jgi:hypothetical protein
MGLIPVKTKQTPQEAVKIPGENAGRETRRHREVRKAVDFKPVDHEGVQLGDGRCWGDPGEQGTS